MDTTIIINFIQTNFTEERFDLLVKSLYLIEELKDEEVYSDVNDVLMQDTLTTTGDKIDNINSIIELKLIEILKNMGIYVNPQYTLPTIISILDSIVQLENLDDKTEIENIISIDDHPEVILSKLVKELTSIDEIKVLDSLDIVEDTVITTIKNFIYKINDIETNNRLNEINSLLGTYFTIFGTENMITEMYKNDVPLGEPIDFYLSQITETEFKDVRDLTLTILGLFLLAGIELDDIIQVFRDKSEELLGDLSVISEVESGLISNISILKMRHNHVEERLS